VSVGIVPRIYENESLLALLPHQYPFLLVDRIDVIEPGRHVIGSKRLTGGEWWSRAGVPNGIPFLLVLEALAQTSGALVTDLAKTSTGITAYFLGADKVRFRHPARVGDVLHLDITLQQWRRGVCRALGVATLESDGSIVATAELTTVVRPSS
jgi:3-hydroxyacyl-[acyl-carrier-protein] dehydratase